MKKAKVASLLSVENSQKPSSKKFIEVKDRWVEVRVTVNYGAAGHVMPEGLFPRVKFERKTPPKKFAAANGERIKDLREKDLHSKHIQRCTTFRSASVVKPLIAMQKVARAGNIVVLDEKNPHIRNDRDGTMIKLGRVCTMDMWICFRQACKSSSIVYK